MRIDLILHFLTGYFIASCFQFTGLWMIVIAVMAGVLKELFDKFHDKETFDWKDLALTFGGGFTAYWIERLVG